jgi:PncC family amidohydrolase
MIVSANLLDLSQKIKDLCPPRYLISTAESCTGGLISASLTATPGASDYYGYGFITYANQAKIDVLGVKAKTLRDFGAVSEAVAIEMAQGCLRQAKSDLALAVTGIAGPSGGTADKPVGTTIFAVATNKGVNSSKFLFKGSRQEIRLAAAAKGLELILENL